MTGAGGSAGRPLESRPEDGSVNTVVVKHTAGTKYVATVRCHEVRVDQPLADGGTDEAPSPVELFVISLATCVAYFAGQYLKRHGVSRTGFTVNAEYRKTGRPARVASINLGGERARGLAGRFGEAIARGRIPLHSAQLAAGTAKYRHQDRQ